MAPSVDAPLSLAQFQTAFLPLVAGVVAAIVLSLFLARPDRRQGSRDPNRDAGPRLTQPAHSTTNWRISMDVTVFSTKPYDRTFLDAAVADQAHAPLSTPLDRKDRLPRQGPKAVCAFVNDQVDADVLAEFKRLGVGLVALRSAGFNNVDLPAAKRQGIAVARVPAYSPDAVADTRSRSCCRRTARRILPTPGCARAISRSTGYSASISPAGRSDHRHGEDRARRRQDHVGIGCKVLAYDLKPSRTARRLGHLPLDSMTSSRTPISLRSIVR